MNDIQERYVIGTHSGGYGLYRALAVAAGTLDPVHKPDLTDTAPTNKIGPFDQWKDPEKIVSIDPYGHLITSVFSKYLKEGLDIRPTIAVTRARIHLPELRDAISAGRLKVDGNILKEGIWKDDKYLNPKKKQIYQSKNYKLNKNKKYCRNI